MVKVPQLKILTISSRSYLVVETKGTVVGILYICPDSSQESCICDESLLNLYHEFFVFFVFLLGMLLLNNCGIFFFNLVTNIAHSSIGLYMGRLSF